MEKYTQQEINEFQMKDKRIIFQSVFSSLCNFYGLRHSDRPEIEQIKEEALKVVEDLIKVYPMMVIKEHVKNQSQGMPF